MKLILNLLFFFLIAVPVTTMMLIAIEVIYFFKAKEKPVYQKPTLRLKHTIVPESFTDKFVWDENLYTNKIIIKA